MKNNSTVLVNGQSYDKHTGLPIDDAPPRRTPTSTRTPHHTAATLHAKAQRSTTLRRTPRPTPKPETLHPLVTKRPQRRSLDIARHSRVQKNTPSVPQVAEVPDIAARVHPHVEKANQKVATKKAAHHPSPRRTLSAKEIKDAEIAHALAAEPAPTVKKPKKHRSHRRKKLTRLGAAGISVAIVIGALIWVNLPVISVQFAAAQAGVAATIPHYTPEGYQLQWPTASADNQVSMRFAAKSGSPSFTLHQASSSWNSDAVRTMVEEASEGRFLTTRDRGLTVYTYNGNAAWVNKGILYTIDGDADLSGDTIMRIANSL